MKLTPTAFSALSAAALTLVLSGCAGYACPAVGYIPTLIVEVHGASDKVAAVQLCNDSGCTPSFPAGTLVSMPTAIPALPMTGSISNGPNQAPSVGVEHSGPSWRFSDFIGPQNFTVKLLAADGSVLASTDASPHWLRVGGTEQCGGPQEATVDITI